MALRITWRQLRQLAESAHGLQEKRLGIRPDVFNRYVVEEYSTGQSHAYLFELDAIPNPKNGKLEVNLPGIRTDRLRVKPTNGDFAEIADAVFWSMAAVEKFLVPYYSSVLELDQVTTAIRNRFADRTVLAFIHLPNSEIIDDGDKDSLANLFAVEPDDADDADGGYKLTAVL